MGENMWYLFAAYSIIWLVVFGYVLLLIKRARETKKDVDELKNRLMPDSSQTFKELL
ncbi:MAG: CcmD family protein [Dehalococcoidia bacterium]|nr:CcmD family protein [Dehalococcoidia bacterium]